MRASPPAVAALFVSIASIASLAACAGASGDESRARDAHRSHADESPEDEAREARAARGRQLAGLEPSAVAPADRAAYFGAVSSIRSTEDRSAPPNPDPDTPNPEAIRKVLLLDSIVGASDPALAAQVREWLIRAAGDFAQAYANQTAKVLASPPSSSWHRAEAAWVAWLSARLATLTEDEVVAVAYDVFGDRQAPAVRWFPGLDRFAFGLAVADLWIREGHPGLTDHNFPASEHFVCSVQNDYGKLSSWCEDGGGWWYRRALASDADTKRLAEAVLARKDAPLTRAVAVGIGLSPKTLDVLHTWEKDAGVWRDALLVVAREDDWHWMRDWLMPEMKRVWTDHPPWHGAILYALAMASGQYPDEGAGEVIDAYNRFLHDVAHGVTRDDFASFLDQTPRAIEFARWAMNERTKGWSVADVILPRLDAYFALPEGVPEGSPTGPGFASIVGHMCYRDHDVAGLAKLKAYFDKRAPSHPGDRLNVMMDSYGPKVCGAER
jgi:hypothetical protein